MPLTMPDEAGNTGAFFHIRIQRIGQCYGRWRVHPFPAVYAIVIPGRNAVIAGLDPRGVFAQV